MTAAARESVQDPPARRNLKLVIAYDGSRYHGWQRQAAGLPTVQQQIEDVLPRILGHPVTIFGAGRTDAGVHAEGQVANLYTRNLAIPCQGLRRAINSRLSGDIAVRSITEVAEDFHASRSATGKTYRYRIHTAPLRPVGLFGQVYHFWRPLDVEAMRSAARMLVGRHDFRGFATTSDQRRTSVRTIFRCDVVEAGSELQVICQGDGFLYNMVRNIVGTLVEIGRGRWQPQQVRRILESRDRSLAGPTALPDGLSLVCVHYDG
jgi:tRNA pseudouridine38-40 synthase